jgi:hypothetical protein
MYRLLYPRYYVVANSGPEYARTSPCYVRVCMVFVQCKQSNFPGLGVYSVRPSPAGSFTNDFPSPACQPQPRGLGHARTPCPRQTSAQITWTGIPSNMYSTRCNNQGDRGGKSPTRPRLSAMQDTRAMSLYIRGSSPKDLRRRSIASIDQCFSASCSPRPVPAI